MANSNEHDWGGLTLIVKDLKVNAATPGATGTALSTTELLFLDGITAGTVTASKALVVGASKEIADLGAVTVKGAFTVGINDTGHDVTLFGATTGKKLVWDESADELVMDGNIKVTAGQKVYTSVANTFYPVILDQAQQAITANGAITITEYSTAITSVTTTGVTYTLADSTVIGQVKRMQLVADGGSDAVVTFNTNATLTFADVGDVAEVIWNGADWLPIALYNCASGDVGPAYVAAA